MISRPIKTLDRKKLRLKGALKKFVIAGFSPFFQIVYTVPLFV
jgi:hypothetical protein